jgi:LPXTG-motif cell wall-anchored protein
MVWGGVPPIPALSSGRLVALGLLLLLAGGALLARRRRRLAP